MHSALRLVSLQKNQDDLEFVDRPLDLRIDEVPKLRTEQWSRIESSRRGPLTSTMAIICVRE